MNPKKLLSLFLLAFLSLGGLISLSGCFYEERHDDRWYHDHPGWHDDHYDHR